MMTNIKKKVSHSLSIINEHKRIYGFIILILSVTLTIIITFVLFTDTLNYNKYRSMDAVKENTISVTRTSSDDASFGNYGQAKLLEELESSTEVYRFKTVTVPNYHYQNSMSETSIININFVSENFFGSPITKGYYLNGDVDYVTLNFGNEFREFDLKNENNPAIISESTRQMLFKNGGGLNETISMDYDGKLQNFTVVGISSDKISTLKIIENDDQVTMPLEMYVPFALSNELTFEKSILQETTVFYEVKDMSSVSQIVRQYKIPNVVQTYQMRLESNQVRLQTSQVTLLLTISIGFLSSINILSLFSIISRHKIHELGIKLSLGASKQDIFLEEFVQVGAIMTLGTVISSSISLFVVSMWVYFKRTSFPNFSMYLSGSNFALLSGYILLQIITCSIIISYRTSRIKIIDALRRNV